MVELAHAFLEETLIVETPMNKGLAVWLAPNEYVCLDGDCMYITSRALTICATMSSR